MMCQQRHEIFITNLKQGDVINHELILVKGIIRQKCSIRTISFTNKESETSRVFNVSTTGEFKAIWLLQKGLNQFRIQYCNKSHELELTYAKLISSHLVQPLYLICKNHDGCFQSNKPGKNSAADACKIITLGLKLVQCIYAEKIAESLLCGDRKTFTLQSDCEPFYANLDVGQAHSLDENSLWNEFAFEILNSEIGSNENLKFVAFIGCTRYQGIKDGDFSYANIKQHTKAHAALGGGGLALFGSACLYTWPASVDDIISCFENNNEIDLKYFWDESNHRRTYGGCYATTLGAVCHEIGHIFDLGHTEDGIMGAGFDYVNRVFTINNLTEILPDRLISTNSQFTQNDTRLTQFKKPHRFLEKYHQQRICDGTFFTRSCALILYYHKWLNNNSAGVESEILLNKNTNSIASKTALKVIEIREKGTGLVVDFLDLTPKVIKAVTLPKNLDYQNYDIFVIMVDGTTKVFK